jgi:hypothetical protein
MTTSTIIRASASRIAMTAKALVTLVNMASPDVKFDMYIALRAKPLKDAKPNEKGLTKSRLTATISCGVLRAEILVESIDCLSCSPLPEAEIICTAQFLSSMDDNSMLMLEMKPNEGSIKYQRGAMRGTVQGIDPSSIINTHIQVTGKSIIIRNQDIRDALDATVFSSVDPSMKSTGVISNIMFDGDQFECTSYDSLCGARYIGSIAPVDPFKLVLPNRLLRTLLSLSSDERAEITLEPGVALKYRTKTTMVYTTLNEYPDIDIGHKIVEMDSTAKQGFEIDPKVISKSLANIISVAASDKEIVNVSVKQIKDRVEFKVNSEMINCAEIVDCKAMFDKSTFEALVDSRRFLNFVKACKNVDMIPIKRGEGFMIVKSSNATFVFSVS